MVLEQKRLDITQVHGTHPNFTPLLEAYQRYSDNADGWYNGRQWDQLEACWCKEVGGAQRQMPAWFVYVFCEEGEDKAWLTHDFKKSFTRDPKHLSWWFDQEYAAAGLGFLRGNPMVSRLLVAGLRRGAQGSEAAVDRATASQFMEYRKNALLELIERLSQTCSRSKKITQIK